MVEPQHANEPPAAQPPDEHHAVVFVHGIGDGMNQGDFLSDVLEPTLGYMAEAGAAFDERHSINLRRGARPARFEVTANVPAANGAGTQQVRWRFYEAMWNDEHREPSPLRAILWWFRAFPMLVVDHLSYYDASWRLQPWNWLRLGKNDRALRYHYDVRWSLGRKFAFCLLFGLFLPLLLLLLFAVPIVVPTGVWLVSLLLRLLLPSGMAKRLEPPRWVAKSVPAYWNLAYRMLLTVAWLPLLLLGAVLLLALLFLALIPIEIPKIGAALDLVIRVIQVRFGDLLVYNRDLVPSGAIATTVQDVFSAALAPAPGPPPASFTVVAHSQGCVVSYEALSALSAELGQTQLTFISAGSMLNRTSGWPWEWRWPWNAGAPRQPVPGRELLAGQLPDGARWVDIFALHDPGPMGAVATALRVQSRAAVFDVPAMNTLTHVSAHTTYWDNPVEVISVVADELLYGSRPGWIPDTSPNGGGAWTNPTGDSGFEAARALRRNTAPRAERGLHVLRQALVAMVRAAAYLTVATVLLDASAAPQWLGDLAGFVDENPPFDQLPARFLHVLVAAVIALVVIEIADAVVRVLLAWRQLRVFLARRYWLA